jgi:hypothetical protein
MRKVHKYSFPTIDSFSLMLPDGAKILMVAPQSGIDSSIGAYLWAEVNPDASPIRRKFRLFGTGHPIENDSLVYVGSYQHDIFVWHLYEEE